MSCKGELKMQENNIDNKQENNKQKEKSINMWYVINIILFISSFLTYKLGSNAFNYLFNMNEYEMGIGMIFLLPIWIFLFGGLMIVLSIASFVFEILSINQIIKKGNLLFKIINLIEIICYVVFFIIRYWKVNFNL